jgi:hypothetical protein
MKSSYFLKLLVYYYLVEHFNIESYEISLNPILHTERLNLKSNTTKYCFGEKSSFLVYLPNF